MYKKIYLTKLTSPRVSNATSFQIILKNLDETG